MSGLIDDDGKAIQPYFAAYMREHGVTRASDVKPVDYIIWNHARWDEWRKLNGKRIDDPKSRAEREDFGRWLERRTAEITS